MSRYMGGVSVRVFRGCCMRSFESNACAFGTFARVAARELGRANSRARGRGNSRAKGRANSRASGRANKRANGRANGRAKKSMSARHG